MSQERSLKRYIWLVDTIRRFQPVTYEALEQRLADSGQFDAGDIKFSERTFFRDANAIESLFGIVLYFDRKTKGYYVKEAGSRKEQEMQAWLLHTFRHANILEVYRNQAEHILLELPPQGSEHLPAILEAIKKQDILSLELKRFQTFKVMNIEVVPYFVRLFHQEWYLVAQDLKRAAVRIFALDTIADIRQTGKKFELPDDEDYPEAGSYFYDYFGITTDENVARETITFKATGSARKRLQRYPLHHSQETVDDTEDYTVFAVRLYPTRDFISELCRYGTAVKVLAPASVRQQMIDFADGIVESYYEEE